MRLISRMAILSVMFIYGCSEEELGESPNPLPEPQQQISKGKFIDSEVQGLNYSTPTQNGVTNSSGEFEYLTGESVTFKVGNIVLGTTEGKSIITPLEIASTENASINSLEVKNISAFLQTLDKDQNLDNGISIDPNVIDFLPENIDFKSNIIENLGELVYAVNTSTLMNLEVVLPEAAAKHLAQSLNLDYTSSGLESGPFFNIIERWETTTRNVMWIHKFDDDNRIIESICYEKYPVRPILKYNYSSYNENGFPEAFSADHTRRDGSEGFIFYFYLEYNNYSEIKNLQYTTANSSTLYGWNFDEFSENFEVLKYTVIGSDPSSFLLEYNNSGKLKTINRVKNGITEDLEEMSYENSGEIKLYSRKFGSNLESYSTRDHEYDSNYLLDKLTRIHAVSGNPVQTNIHFYNDEESETRMEEYIDDFLSILVETDYEESLRTSTYFNQDGSYSIKYEDFIEGYYKTEYYDSDGNLISTEEH